MAIYTDIIIIYIQENLFWSINSTDGVLLTKRYGVIPVVRSDD